MPPHERRSELPAERELFRRRLHRWFARHGRDLPWRQTRDPYAVLVSEFMLQQTQVATVLPYYKKWLERFPSFGALARAPENDVLHAWQGLGYYARARNLHGTAKAVVDQYRGNFPRRTDQTRDLPGIGKYTANAIATFAFDESVPIVEANTARVLARLFNLQAPVDQSIGRKALWDHATSLLPGKGARAYNSALMDLGALICLPRPKCAICPVRKFCRASNPENLPRKKSRPELQNLTENHAFVVRSNEILLEQSSSRWRNMWILPASPRKATAQGVTPECFKHLSLSERPIHTLVFPFTHHRVKLRVFSERMRKIDTRNQRWIPIGALDSIPIPSPHRRAIAALLS
ncbi:MAG: A/G-specific adenine glycosylase [Verrucomicrobiota bacterium]